MSDKYILVDGKPVEEPDLYKWGVWMQENNRTIQVTRLPYDIRVSTIFLGLDHSYGDGGGPVLWETMVFGHTEDYQERYITKESALVDHNRIAMMVLDDLQRSHQPRVEPDSPLPDRERRIKE